MPGATGRVCAPATSAVEARFYDRLGAELDGLIPAFYADWDDNRRNGIVVMETSPTPRAFGTGDDDLESTGSPQASSRREDHAASWGDPRLESWTWLHRNIATANDTEQVILYWNYICTTSPTLCTEVRSAGCESPERLAHALDELAA